MSAHQQNNIQPVIITPGESPCQGSMTSEDRNTIHDSATRRINPGDVQEVVLERGEHGFGLFTRGIEDMPLFVLELAEGMPAYEDGRIKVKLIFKKVFFILGWDWCF